MAAVVLSLAVGIGANSVVFTALNALMLMSLPVGDASELFLLTSQGTNAAAAVAPARFSYKAFNEFRRAAPVPQALAAMGRVAECTGVWKGATRYRPECSSYRAGPF